MSVAFEAVIGPGETFAGKEETPIQNGVSIYGHQQPGGITEQGVRALLMLPGSMLPAQIISLLGLGGPSFPLANHYDHIHIGY